MLLQIIHNVTKRLATMTLTKMDERNLLSPIYYNLLRLFQLLSAEVIETDHVVLDT